MLLSIVLPFYNPMPHFERMLESLYINNILDLCNGMDVEVICINDGSTDDSVRFIKSLDLPQNFHLLSVENGGVSKARNFGLSLCKGEYVWFADADDIIPARSISIVASKLNSLTMPVDILFANFYAFEESHNTINQVFHSQYLFKYFLDDSQDSDDKFDLIFNKSRVGLTIWNQIFNVGFLKRHSLNFNNNYCVSEDFMFKIEAVYKSNSFDCIENEIYGYRVPNGRKTLSQRVPKFQDVEPLIDDQARWFNTFENEYCYCNGSRYMRLLFAEAITMWLNYFKNHEINSLDRIDSKYKELDHIINYLPKGVSALFHKGI